MSLAVPTTSEVSDTIVSQLEASLSQTIPLLPKAFSRVLAKVLAGVFVLIYKYAGFIFLQLFVQYASFQETTINGKTIRPLVEWGRLIGVGDPDEATRAELVVDVTVTNQTGQLAAGAHLLRAETGVGYQTLYPVDLDAATVQVAIRATSDEDGNGGEGTIGNLNAGDEISFVNPLPNVASLKLVFPSIDFSSIFFPVTRVVSLDSVSSPEESGLPHPMPNSINERKLLHTSVFISNPSRKLYQTFLPRVRAGKSISGFLNKPITISVIEVYALRI